MHHRFLSFYPLTSESLARAVCALQVAMMGILMWWRGKHSPCKSCKRSICQLAALVSVPVFPDFLEDCGIGWTGGAIHFLLQSTGLPRDSSWVSFHKMLKSSILFWSRWKFLSVWSHQALGGKHSKVRTLQKETSREKRNRNSDFIIKCDQGTWPF